MSDSRSNDLPALSRKPLRVLFPEIKPRSIDIDLSPQAILTPEQLRQRQIDLGSIAARRHIAPPNDIYVV